jgi:D-alanyl-D-alanine carboxypeptidase/D-alanyl-D-alanine-endopeptidase (penicillin-binding protein 4)
VKKVDRIVIDDRIFDAQRVHPNWPTDQLHLWYCAEVAGLNFNNNCLDIYATPTRPGESPIIHTQPLNAPVVLTTAARTGRKNAVWPTREPGTNRITIRGEVKHRLTRPIYVTVDDPPMLFAKTFRDRLVSAGVTVEGIARADDDFQIDGARLIAEVRTPMREVLARCNKDSQNLFAEALIKRIGHETTGDPGSWLSGSAAIRMFLSKALGPDASNFVIDDGSGMSRETALPPPCSVNCCTGWIAWARSARPTASRCRSAARMARSAPGSTSRRSNRPSTARAGICGACSL